MEDVIIKSKMQTALIVCNAVGLLFFAAPGFLLVLAQVITPTQFVGLGLLGWAGGLLIGCGWAKVIQRRYVR